MNEDNLIRIYDFQDFNYERVAFDLTCMCRNDKIALRDRLRLDNVNHLSRMDNSNYFAIWNSDFQDFPIVENIYFDSELYDYELVKLCFFDGEWYYKLAERRVVEEHMRY